MKIYRYFPILIVASFSTFVVNAGTKDSIKLLKSLSNSQKKTAIIIVDMQNGFRNGMDIKELMKKSKKLNKVINYAASHDILTINVVIPTNTSVNEATLLQKLRHDKIKTYYKLYNDAFRGPKPGDPDLSLFEKRVNEGFTKEGSAVINDDLESYLLNKDVTDLYVAGCFDRLCVSDTTEGALIKGFNVHVDRDMNVSMGGVGTEGITEGWKELKDTYPTQLNVFSNSLPLSEQYNTSTVCTIQ
ncbi:isochorismatase family protein [Vibrio sp. 10N.261.52.A1]|uniref:isochorismatase family protein n=1 Tax=Vibrio TaxID=662 RepID=UPI000C862764|nr:isochorismatase family protein [Vibrio sp. 10N.261.52.A1]PML15940.1 hypothetical protein BCT81_04525 [Vibrio sp. 10N.261.52.A1]